MPGIDPSINSVDFEVRKLVFNLDHFSKSEDQTFVDLPSFPFYILPQGACKVKVVMSDSAYDLPQTFINTYLLFFCIFFMRKPPILMTSLFFLVFC